MNVHHVWWNAHREKRRKERSEMKWNEKGSVRGPVKSCTWWWISSHHWWLVHCPHHHHHHRRRRRRRHHHCLGMHKLSSTESDRSWSQALHHQGLAPATRKHKEFLIKLLFKPHSVFQYWWEQGMRLGASNHLSNSSELRVTEEIYLGLLCARYCCKLNAETSSCT